MRSKPTLPSEAALLELIATRFATRRRDVRIGVGDDAAVVRLGGDAVLTTDTLVEDVDFRATSDPHALGRKALAASLSDLAAMGAAPAFALLTLGLPRATPPAFLEGILDGFGEIAAEYQVAIVGGDLTSSATAFLSVTAVGRPAGLRVLTRSGASAGDVLFVSGTLGAAAGGLALLEAGYRVSSSGTLTNPAGRRLVAPPAADLVRLIRHQTSPRPMVELGQALAEGDTAPVASAAMDLSDGLARDLHRLCRASGCGAAVDLARLPVDSTLEELPAGIALEPRAAALFGGEDFGLLFTVPKKRLAAVERLAARFALRAIGEMTPGSSVVVRGGARTEPLPDAGFDHFESGEPDPAARTRKPR
ncbi:MAG: thiamine-phosphate kinase [Acidobacteria bacterium]|nr:thiamine-phosphate kinase [Acidobacteriota bacterium]